MKYVLKFGGSTIKSNLDIVRIANFIRVEIDKAGEEVQLVVVVGARHGMTAELLDEASTICENPPERELDALLATGEQVVAAKLAMALTQEGLPAISMTGMQAGISTTANHREARVRKINTSRIEKEVEKGQIVVVTGFQGSTQDGDITTFDESYGGSDLTAILIAAALGWDCILYKDIDGIYTVNPSIFPRARKQTLLDYREAALLGSSSADIVEAYAVEIANTFQRKIYITSIGKDYETGTVVTSKDVTQDDAAVTIITYKNHCCTATIYDCSNDLSQNLDILFEKAREKEITLDVAIREEFGESWSATVSYDEQDTEHMQQLMEEVTEGTSMKFEIRKNLSVLTLCGLGMEVQSGVVAKAVEALVSENIKCFNITTSDITISFVINRYDLNRAILSLSKKFKI